MAKPDGYTLLIHGTAAVVGNTVLLKDPGYDAMDLQPVATLAESTFVLTVGPTAKAGTVKELIANLKEAGGKMKYGTATAVTLVASEKFLIETGTKAGRVSYKATTDAARDELKAQLVQNIPYFKDIPTICNFAFETNFQKEAYYRQVFNAIRTGIVNAYTAFSNGEGK